MAMRRVRSAGGPCQHTIAANGMCVHVDDHEVRFRKDYARGPAISRPREVYRGIKLATGWPETAARRNPIHPGGGTDLSVFFRTADHGHAPGQGDREWSPEQHMGGDEMPDYADDDEGEADVDSDVEVTPDSQRARMQAEMMPMIDEALALYRRELLAEGPELQRLHQLVIDTTDRVLTDKDLLADWVGELRQHFALPFPLDMTQRDSVLSFAKAVVVHAVMQRRSQQLRTAIAAFTNHVNGTRFGVSSTSVEQQPPRKRGRRSGK